MIVLFLNFFMKSYAVGTQDHYYYLFDKILICNHSNSFFYKEISKELSDSFYCIPFLLGGSFTKDSLDSAGKKNN